jgi:hypothetical protein
MNWITRAHVHVDRVACPWLIKRFIDSEARFFFVAPSLVTEQASALSAIPFDVLGAELGHHDGQCSFLAFLKKYKLTDPALLAMGEAVNAADTNSLDGNPYAPGLEAIAKGYSLLYPNDAENLVRQFPVYDSLYAFFKTENKE